MNICLTRAIIKECRSACDIWWGVNDQVEVVLDDTLVDHWVSTNITLEWGMAGFVW